MDLKEITERTQREIAQLKESNEKAEHAMEVRKLDHLMEQRELEGLIGRREMEVAKEKDLVEALNRRLDDKAERN